MPKPFYKLALLGHPVDRSLSPVIHTAALERLGVPGSYVALDVRPDALRAVIRGLREDGYRGVNVTLPHKETALLLMDRLSPSAKAIGAVNTIVVEPDELLGENTDHIGFAAPLHGVRPAFSGATALILGAGGAARGVAFALSRLSGIDRIQVSSRRQKQAIHLKESLAPAGIQLESVAWPARSLAARAASLVVNTTPVGMWPHVEASPVEPDLLGPGQVAYDLVYKPIETRFLAQARDSGATCIPGLPMLIGQAAASFRLWTGREMPHDAVLDAVEATLNPSNNP